MHKLKYCLFLSVLITTYSAVLSQSLSSSPYTRYGIGDVQENNISQSQALGGLDQALQSPTWINYANPATYSALDLSTLQTGIKLSLTEQATADSKQKVRNGNMTSIAIGIPLKKFWALSFGLLPYSSVGYKISTDARTPIGDDVTYVYNGSGGLNRVFLGSGIQLFPNKQDSSLLKGLSLGANASYIFGSLNYERRAIFYNNTSFYNLRETDLYELNDFTFDYGLHYKVKLKKKWALSAGATLATKTNISGKHSGWAQTFTLSNGYELDRDTISSFKAQKGSITLPTRIGFGIILHYGDKVQIGIDYKTQDWSNYSGFGVKDSLKNSNSFALGFQYTPNSTNGRGFWKHVQYRAGVNYANTYLKIRNNLLTQQFVSLGAGFPIIKSVSTLNVAFNYGTRGTIENSLLKEKFYAIHIGLTFSDKWFIKRKFD